MRDDSVHARVDEYVRDYVGLDPVTATVIGEQGSDALLTDFSPEAVTERAELGKRALAEVRRIEPADDAERIAKAVFTERMEIAGELFDAGEEIGALNVIESPVHSLREVFDLMPAETEQQWATLAARMRALPRALEQVRAGLEQAARAGHTAAVRQVDKVATQCARWSGDGGRSYFHGLLDDAPEALADELGAAANTAAGAYAGMSEYLREQLAPKAPRADAVGADRYRLHSRQFTGAALDLDEAYQWAWEEFARIEAEMVEVAGRIEPGASPARAAELLDADPRHRVTGTDGLAAWLQQVSDEALSSLRDTHFTLPDELMRLDCKIAPPGGVLGAYYIGPTDDFGRPGSMWWSVDHEQPSFPVWRDATTVYHEGVPGHHLQVATAVYHADRLNRFQRQLCFISGHGEGWALYAEQLMRELGHLGTDHALLGLLDAQIFRTARVLVDIGMHLELSIPAGTGFHEGQRWSPELGLEFMTTRTLGAHDYLADEVDRYLGWPGQAPSYKLGERAWLAAREQARSRAGESFDSKAFHGRALELGPIGLDALGAELARSL
ncbi:DUF885 domain-containing protein [Sciscionella marina]|uniref:DUF885 domain-containing protein n=1 Tax=Sciscionella marina TaxID=508770 RepID=UPI000382AF6A|nr:DUF885 domain-containing protein [Sciscionella marina]